MFCINKDTAAGSGSTSGEGSGGHGRPWTGVSQEGLRQNQRSHFHQGRGPSPGSGTPFAVST